MLYGGLMSAGRMSAALFNMDITVQLDRNIIFL
jgi:hypothetical protein